MLLKKTQKTIYSLFLEKIGWIQKHHSELKFEYGGMKQLLLKTIVHNSTFFKKSLFFQAFLTTNVDYQNLFENIWPLAFLSNNFSLSNTYAIDPLLYS